MFDGKSLRNCPAPAKLNLFLHITGRRADGYHTLQSAFQLLDWGDTLHFSCRNDGKIIRSNSIVGVPAEQDLTVKAARLLQAYTHCSLGAEIAVEKSIPMGAGLGGGSSDAATTLLVLNRLWHLGLPRAILQTLALQLGADVTFFIFGQNAFAEGIGDCLSPLQLPPLHYLIVTPKAHVPTAEIYNAQELTRNSEIITITDFMTAPETHRASRSGANNRRTGLFGRNDMQAVVVEKYPEVAQVLDWFAAEKIASARMSGSGASVFAAFAQREQAEAAYAKAQSKGSGDWKSVVASGVRYHPLFSYAV